MSDSTLDTQHCPVLSLALLLLLVLVALSVVLEEAKAPSSSRHSQVRADLHLTGKRIDRLSAPLVSLHRGPHTRREAGLCVTLTDCVWKAESTTCDTVDDLFHPVQPARKAKQTDNCLKYCVD